MARNVYWKNCIQEIRQSVYGRDNRKPIADAIEKLADRREFDKLDIMAAKLQTAVHSFEGVPMETWYTYDYENIELRDADSEDDKIAEAVTDRLSTSLIDGEEYLLNNSISESSVQLISGDDYLMIVPNPITHTYTHHGEDYILTIVRINGM